MDYKKITQILMKEIRGSSSQNMINKSLGFKYNQYAKWEKGRAHISWKQFVKLCRILKIDLLDILTTSCSCTFKTTKPKSVITSFIGDDNINQFAKKHNLSRFKLARWLSEQSEPAVQDILKLIDLSSPFRLRRFLFHFKVDCEMYDVPSTVSQNDIRNRNPLSNLAIACLGTKEYIDQPKHTDGFLEKKLGISLQDELELIDFMISNGLLERKNQKLVTPNKMIESDRPAAIENQLDFFHSLSRKYYMKNKERTDKNLLALVSISTTTEVVKQIRRTFFQALENMEKTIIKSIHNKEDADQVAHLVVQLYDPTELD